VTVSNDAAPTLQVPSRAILVALVIFAAAGRFAGLGTPPKQIFDEIYYARAAQEYLAGAPIFEWTHPPLSKLLIASGIWGFGPNAWGWRFAAAVAGVLTIPAMYLLGACLFRSERMGMLAAGITALDSLLLVESRIAKPEAFLAAFLSGAYALWWYSVRTGRVVALYGAGALAGAALATKWTGGAGIAILMASGILTWRRREAGWSPRHLAVALLIIPAVVYAACYAPHALRGESAADILRLHRQMFEYHSRLVAQHPYASAWWTWPLLLRPMWYHYEASDGYMTGVFAVGNPVLWWSILPAMLFAAAAAARRGATEDWFLVVAFAAVYLPYAFIGRLLFVYHMVPALIPAFLAIAAGLRALRRSYGPRVPAAYLAAAAVVVAYQYPVLAAVSVPQSWLRWWTWMRTWV
jgi:dolichyl-phosphate-mannose--protein O-mannosyl transferase